MEGVTEFHDRSIRVAFRRSLAELTPHRLLCLRGQPLSLVKIQYFSTLVMVAAILQRGSLHKWLR